MASSTSTTNGDIKEISSLKLENLLLRDEDIFQTSLNSQDYLESLAPIIKDAIQSNGLANLINKLNEIVAKKDEELFQASLESMGEISSCINTIDKVQTQSQDLNKQFFQVSSSLNKSAFELMSRKQQYVKYKEVSKRIDETQVVLNECIQVLELMNKILELIRQTKYFSALKLIDELINIHVKKVSNFSFARKIVNSIPHLTKMIKEESFENLSKWLSINMERKINTISDSVFENIQRIQDDWDTIKLKNKDLDSYKVNSPVELALRSDRLQYDLFSDPALQISLNTVYDTILVYQTLHEVETLSILYHKEWMRKYARILYPLSAAVTDSHKEIVLKNRELDAYLKKLAAFFVMDKQLNLVTKFQLRNNNQANELWISCINKLKPVILFNLKNNDFYDIDELTDFKIIVGDFLQVMDNNDYDVTELYEIMMSIFKDYYAPLIVQSFRRNFVDSMQSDFYEPVYVDKKADYINIINTIFYKKGSSYSPENVTKFPMYFPFSNDYLRFCEQIRKLINEILGFIKDYHYTSTDYEVIQIIDLVLGDEKGFGIGYDIKEFIDKNVNNKEIVVQSFINLESYLLSIYEIGVLINNKLKNYNSTGLKSIQTFQTLKKHSEDTIFKMLDRKLIQLLEMVEYVDFFPRDRNRDANYFIKDLCNFINDLYLSLTKLPQEILTLVPIKVMDQVSEYFSNVLDDTPEFNANFIHNFETDFKYIEDSFAKLQGDSSASTPAFAFGTIHDRIFKIKSDMNSVQTGER